MQKQIQLTLLQRSIMHLLDENDSHFKDTMVNALQDQEEKLLLELKSECNNNDHTSCDEYLHYAQKKLDRLQAHDENIDSILKDIEGIKMVRDTDEGTGGSVERGTRIHEDRTIKTNSGQLQKHSKQCSQLLCSYCDDDSEETDQELQVLGCNAPVASEDGPDQNEHTTTV